MAARFTSDPHLSPVRDALGVDTTARPFSDRAFCLPYRFVMSLSLAQRSLLEAMGTAALAHCITLLSHSDLSRFAQACTIGLMLSLLIHLLGRFTGAHLNPAVTLLLNQRRWGWKGVLQPAGLLETLAYASAQIGGAIVGFWLDPRASAGQPLVVDGFASELTYSLLLFGLILIWSREGRLCPFAQPLSGVVIGGGVAVLVLLGGLSGSGFTTPPLPSG